MTPTECPRRQSLAERKRSLLILALPQAFVIGMMLAGTAQAQVRPDAGALQQQIDRERQQALPPRGVIERPAEPPAMTPPGAVTIKVTAFRFAGNTLLRSDQLSPAVEAFRNRPLDFNELQKAAAAVATAYRDAGWIVRAYLPRQDITSGTVTIQIVEAVFGGMRLEGPNPTRTSSAKIMDMVEAQQKVGEPLNADALDRALLIASDLPGVTVAGSLGEGKRSGETDLVLKFTDKPLVSADAALDNTGSRSTGPARFAGNISVNSPFGAGEQLSANFIHTQNSDRLASDGSDYLRLALSHPVGLDGLRLGINASYLKYNLIAPEYAALDAYGTSATIGLEATYPLIRSRMQNLYLNANIDHKSFDNRSLDTVTSRYMSDTLTLGLSGNLFDNFGGGGANSASLSIVDGILNLDGSPNRSADALTTRTAGNFTKIRFSVSRQQAITEELSFYAAYSGQWAVKNLDSSEKFYIGGANGVRAYPMNEGGGSDAHLLNLELRQRLPYGFTMIGFFDYGRVLVNHNNHFGGAGAPNGYDLTGGGISAVWQSDIGPTLKATWAHRIGGNPNPTATGYDQDGSLVVDRFWLSASMAF